MRRADWKPRLALYLSQVVRKGFAPGAHDCALFAAGAVEAMTGIDIAAPFRGRYRTIRGGIRILRAAGHADHIALARVHFAEVHKSRATPGDLAILPTEDGMALGVVHGEMVFVLSARGGMGMKPVQSAVRILQVV